MKRTIEVVISANGETRAETKGFRGGDCREASQFLERALGERSQEALKSEFYEVATNDQSINEGS